jgi:hypothetical protein
MDTVWQVSPQVCAEHAGKARQHAHTNQRVREEVGYGRQDLVPDRDERRGHSYPAASRTPGGAAMTIPLIASVGLVLLIVLAVGVGASLDTTAQHRARRHVAEERRMLAQAMAQWQDPRCDLCRGHLRRPGSR